MVLSNNSLPPRALLTSTVRPEVGAEIPYAALYGFPVHNVHRVHSLPVKITVPKGEKEPPPPLVLRQRAPCGNQTSFQTELAILLGNK